ncbi:MAG TPA: DUF882 domain-containing protein [Candidatus Binataceae bacterium]|nr:DUF882 domain-containing protein [Candidatus Binataceae bacterium]
MARRAFIKSAIASTALLAFPGAVAAGDWMQVWPVLLRRRRRRGPAIETPRTLAFHNVHTGESIRTTYWERGAYLPQALHEINYFFRDFRANEVKPIDPRLLDLLTELHAKLAATQPFDLISGYRSAATNAWLAAQSEGVARHSMHVEAKAADIHLPGVELKSLQMAALDIGEGGVGYYPRSGFVHVDTGRVRRW